MTRSFNLDSSGPFPKIAYFKINLWLFFKRDRLSKTKWCPFRYSNLATVHKSYFFFELGVSIDFIKAG